MVGYANFPAMSRTINVSVPQDADEDDLEPDEDEDDARY